MLDEVLVHDAGDRLGDVARIGNPSKEDGSIGPFAGFEGSIEKIGQCVTGELVDEFGGKLGSVGEVLLSPFLPMAAVGDSAFDEGVCPTRIEFSAHIVEALGVDDLNGTIPGTGVQRGTIDGEPSCARHDERRAR